MPPLQNFFLPNVQYLLGEHPLSENLMFGTPLVLSKRLIQIYFRFKKHFFTCKNRFIGENIVDFQFYFSYFYEVQQFCKFRQLHRKNHIKINQTILSNFIQRYKKKVDKKYIFSSEKMRNSANYIYDYAQSFFGKDLQLKPLYW